MKVIEIIYKKLWLILLIGLALACEKKEKISPPDINNRVSADFKVITDSSAFGRIIVVFKMERWTSCTIDYGDGFERDYFAHSNQDVISIESGIGAEHFYKENKEYKITLTAYRRNEFGTVTQAFMVQTVRISNVPPKAEAGFSYELLDNGVVRFTNHSQNALSYEWRGSPPYYSKAQNPTFRFEQNGTFPITLSAYSPFYVSTKSVNINITNVKEEEAPSFTGTYLKYKGTFKGTGNVRYDGACCDGIPSGIPFVHFTVPDTDIDLILITSSLNIKDYTLADKYNAIKESFSVGEKNTTYPNWWGGFVILGIPIERDVIKTLEITEVQEVSQAKLVPEIYEKALWITFKIKGDFKEYGRIDGVLKLKYLVY